MAKFNDLIGLMKKCDERSDHLFNLQNESLERKSLLNKNKLFEDLNSLLEIEPQINKIIESEELIKLYFYRFLVSDNKTNDELNAYYLRAKEKCKQLLVHFLKTVATIASKQISSDNNLDIESNYELLAKVFKQFQNKALKSMAENEIKSYETKQLMQNYGLKTNSFPMNDKKEDN